MNQEAILQSNLLDIIFENRNKDYGAYTLRKFYNNRIIMAIFSMLGFSLAVSIFLLTAQSPLALVHDVFKLPAHENILSVYTPQNHSSQVKAEKIISKTIIKIPVEERPPRIVNVDDINKAVATPIQDIPSLSPVDGPENSSLNGIGTGDGANKGIGKTVVPEVAKTNKGEALEIAEIMPQYPGGIPALLAFLKKNIQSPEGLENGDEVKVEIRFVVNYNGKLERFDVIKTGGATFDNEVLRVLKKMPLWVPGKTKGENVSVYYAVPVKFTSGF